MENWIDSIIEYIFLSSALLLLLGGVSLLIVHTLNIRGRAKLIICSIVILMPLVYPFQSLLPDHVRFPVPLENLRSFYSKPVVSSDESIFNDRMPAGGTEAVSNVRLSNIKTLNSNIEIPYPEALKPGYKRLLSHPINWKQIIAISWAAIFIIILVRFVLIIKKIRILRKCANSVTDPHILRLLRQCTTETGLMKMPRLMTIECMMSPIAVGFFQPTVIIPERLLAPGLNEGLRFVLLHELKHLQRLDNWWLLIESLINAAYFFHPVIYWAKNKIHEEWEYLCDSHVVQVTNKPLSYADFLLHEIWRQSHGMNPSAAKPFISSVSKTTRRVKSILEKRTPTLLNKLCDRMAVSIIFLSFVSIHFCSISPSAHVKESETDINQVSVENPDAHKITAKFDSSLNSTTAFSNNVSVSALPEKTPDESSEVIHSSILNNPETVNSFYSSVSEEIAKGYDRKPVKMEQVETVTGSQTLSKNNRDSSDAGVAEIAALQEHTSINITDNQSVAGETPLRQEEFNSMVVYLDIDKENRLVQIGDDYPVIIHADLIEFNEDDKDEKAAPSNVDGIPDKYNLDNQLERISKIWKRDPVSWQSIDYQSFILENGFSYYLIVLNTPDYRLPFRETLQIGNLNEIIRPGYDNVNGYVIYKIYKFKNHEQANAIRIQLSGDKDKTDVDANT